MVRGRQLDPTLRARIFELRATGYGAKKIHKILPDVPFNTIKTTLRRSKALAPGAGPGLTPTTSRGMQQQQPLSDDASPSASPSLDPNLSVAPPLTITPNPTPIRPAQQQSQQQQQQQQQQTPQQSHPQDLQRQQQAQQQQQAAAQQLQNQHQRGTVPPVSGAATPSSDSQARAARARASASDLLNEILPPGGGGSLPGLAAATTANPALDLDRLKADYRAMTDAQRAAADAELDLRKAALVSVRWEARRELEAARRQAQLEQLQQLQQEGLDPEAFYARFRELVSPGQAANGAAVSAAPATS